jgi:hypothetical protein
MRNLTAIVCGTKSQGTAFPFEAHGRIFFRARKTRGDSFRERWMSTEYFRETADREKVAPHSLFLNGASAGAVFRREGKSRTNVVIEGCQKPLNPK